MRSGLLVLACLSIGPLSIGAISIEATSIGALSIEATAHVDRRDSMDFRYDVLPYLHRQECGSAYCHGSATGRGGFKLSLFASDPRADHAAITREMGGRRLDLKRPDHSLLLRKPSLATRHGGGRRLRPESQAHRALTGWIAAGAPFRSDATRELIGLEMTIQGERIRARARFRDRSGEYERDVTALSTFRSSDGRIAAVDAEGVLTMGEPGEAWLFARYVTRSARVPIVRPFGRSGTPTATSHPHIHNVDDTRNTEDFEEFDQIWLRRLREIGLRPAKPASAPTLARRLYLDLADRLPTPAELREFLSSDGSTRVAATAGRLVESEDFARKFGRHLAQWLEIPLEPPSRPNPRTPMFQQQHHALVAAVARGDTLTEIAERLLVRDRRLLDRFPDPRDRAELTGRAFLGIRIGCARCHNSPVDKWEQKDHLAFSALFASRRPDPKGGMRPGILFHPVDGREVTPRVLPMDAPKTDTTAQPSPSSHSHEEAVADFVLRGEHGKFERNVANRTFAVLMGSGLVEPLDDHRLSNPAIHEPILDHLAAIARSGDLRRLVVHIVKSRMYQTSSTPSSGPEETGPEDTCPEDAAGSRFFARRTARTMPPATFANAIGKALGVSEPPRLTKSPLARQLALLNGGFLHDSIARSPALEVISRFAPDATSRLRDLFVLLLSREPRAREIAEFRRALSDANGNASKSVGDLAFALLCSREFGSIR